MTLLFIESPTFTNRVVALDLEEQLRGLQGELIANPESGSLERACGGLRKVRMAEPERKKGKRGGVRVLYLLHREADTIFLVYVFSKRELDAVPDSWRPEFKRLAERLKSEWR